MMHTDSRYETVIDRRLLPLLLVVPAALIVAIVAHLIGSNSTGRLLISVGVLGPAAALGAVYAEGRSRTAADLGDRVTDDRGAAGEPMLVIAGRVPSRYEPSVVVIDNLEHNWESGQEAVWPLLTETETALVAKLVERALEVGSSRPGVTVREVADALRQSEDFVETSLVVLLRRLAGTPVFTASFDMPADFITLAVAAARRSMNESALKAGLDQAAAAEVAAEAAEALWDAALQAGATRSDSTEDV